MSREAAKDTLLRPAWVAPIDEQVFHALIAERAQSLLTVTRYLAWRRTDNFCLTRPLLGELLLQAAQTEELLDAYGARNNRRWSRFRALTAALKLFANVGYKLIHVQHVLPSYRLLPIEQDFAAVTQQTLTSIQSILSEAARFIQEETIQLGLPLPEKQPRREDYLEQLPAGRLLHDRAIRQTNNVTNTVTRLATAFLNLAAESEILHVATQIQAEEYASCFPDIISEENLRYLKHQFHNLQSRYDTSVSATELEYLDDDLRVLRGHISVVFHLLETATEFAHYFERHVNIPVSYSALGTQPVVTAKMLLTLLMDYSLAYASRYLVCGQRLCYGMLKRYAEVGRIEVPVPRYRGFHVRPATLVAKIVIHYGSEVRMELDQESYDASSPMDLFRANEKINARKRRWLASEIARLSLGEGALNQEQLRTAVLDVVLKLAEQGKLIIYEQPLQTSTESARQNDGLLAQVTDEIARLQAMGKIDINTDLKISFMGDKRILADIELLAAHGYGEDSFGNNVPLPKELGYLRRQRRGC